MSSTSEGSPEPNLPYAVIFGCIMAVGLPLNAVSLWILLRHHSIKSSSAVFMVNLVISDLLLAISLPMRVYVHATGSWPLDKTACRVITMLFRDNIRTSSIFITFISVDRLLAVVFPLRSRGLRTSCNAWKAVVLAWLFIIMMNIPEGFHLQQHLKNDTCFQYASPEGSAKHPVVYYQPVLVLTMLSVNIVCTAMVFWTLRRHLSDSARVHNKVNVMLLFALSLVMFIVCFVPVSIALLADDIPHIRPFICLATLNCCLDPLLYYFSFDGFWKKKENVRPARQL